MPTNLLQCASQSIIGHDRPYGRRSLHTTVLAKRQGELIDQAAMTTPLLHVQDFLGKGPGCASTFLDE